MCVCVALMPFLCFGIWINCLSFFQSEEKFLKAKFTSFVLKTNRGCFPARNACLHDLLTFLQCRGYSILLSMDQLQTFKIAMGDLLRHLFQLNLVQHLLFFITVEVFKAYTIFMGALTFPTCLEHLHQETQQ